MNEEDRQKMLDELLKSKRIKLMYDEYIIKSIPFEVWVENTMDQLLNGDYNGNLVNTDA